MGKTADWTRIFEDLEYFLYGAKLERDGLSPFDSEIIRGSDDAFYADGWKRAGLIYVNTPMGIKGAEEQEERIFYEEVLREVTYMEDGVISSFEELEKVRKSIDKELEMVIKSSTDLMSEKMALNHYGEVIIHDFYKKDYSEVFNKMPEDAERETAMWNYSSSEANEENIWSYPVMEKKFIRKENTWEKLGREEREKIIKSSYGKNGVTGGNIKFEMHNVNNLEKDVDIDKVTDMLTDRLYEMMQKSAEGFYM